MSVQREQSRASARSVRAARVSRDARVLPSVPSGRRERGRRADTGDWAIVAALGIALALMLVVEQVRIALLGW